MPPHHSERSLQRRLAWRLGSVLVLSMAIAIGVMAFYTWDVTGELDDINLQVQARQIARQLTTGDGRLDIRLPSDLAEAYAQPHGGFHYAVVDADGTVIVASSTFAEELAAIAPPVTPDDSNAFFRVPAGDGSGKPYYAMAMYVSKRPGTTLIVAQGGAHSDVFTDSLVQEIGEHVAWTMPIILALALAISIWTIRSSLTPLKELSARAIRIGPNTTELRLSTTSVPREIRPLVDAVNSALDRLEQGFSLQRRFTANAAHELRTPLAIVTARLDELADDDTVAALREDVQRMNRLVDQLLRVSRLDAGEVRPDDVVDLNVIAADIAGYLAPLAIRERRTISLTRAEQPVRVLGHGPAIGDALRNLIENALEHTPEGTEVCVSVDRGGSVSVSDQGPGIADDDRQRIFERFWRKDRRTGSGSGLGLAIVVETAQAHGGSVTIDDRPGRGATFTLALPRAGEA